MPSWDLVHSQVFAPGGKRLAYVATTECELNPGYRLMLDGWRFAKGGKSVLVTRSVAGKKEDETAEYEAIAYPVFSPDGKSIAFAAVKDGKWRVVCGEQEGEAADEIGPLQPMRRLVAPVKAPFS